MKILNRLSCAFVAGVLGAIVLDILGILIYGMPHSAMAFKTGLYQLCIWGGIWALLLAIPLWDKHWFIRGSIIGIIVILFNYIVLFPATGHGFFASHLPVSQALENLLNYVWGVVAGLWFYLATKSFSPVKH